MAPLEISETRLGDVDVLSLKGRLIADEADALFLSHVDALIARGRAHIVADFQGVTSIDSGGVGTLVAKLLSTRRAGGDLRLSRVTHRTRRVLEITHLLSVFHVFDSIDDAVQSFSMEVPRLPAGTAAPDRGR